MALHKMDLQLECSDVDLKEIADMLGKNWKTMAKALGLDKNGISKIEESGDANAFAGIISHWKRHNTDTPLSFIVLVTELCESAEYRGRQEYLTKIMHQILEKKTVQSGIDTELEPTKRVPLHPKCSLDPAADIGSQFSALLEALTTCTKCIELDDLKDIVMDISGQSSSSDSDEIADVSSVKAAFEVLTSSVDVELLECVLQKFQCDMCSNYLNKYKDNMKKSKYSKHSLPQLKEGMNCVTCVFRGVPNSSDPLCEVILAKKSFCSAFKINMGALRLVDCREHEDGVIALEWRILPHMVDVLQKESRDLRDSSLKILASLKLRSLRVDTVTVYFYQINDDDAELSSSPTPATFQPGDSVMVRNDIDEAEKLQEGHGGWNQDMEEILGKQAYILQIDSDKDALLYIPAVKRKYVLNPELLEKTTNGSDKSIEISDKQSPTFEVGDVVVLCDLHKLITIQSKHNGITDDMCQNAGDIAFVVHIHDKDYVRADMLPMRRTFHPNALIKIPRDKTKVEEGIEFLKDKIANDSAFMECVKKARSESSDVHNLLMAILFRDENKLGDYLENCHDKINSIIYKKCTALHLATLTGNITFVRILLEKGAKLDSKNEQGFAPLHFATMSKFKDIATVLLECQGGNINLKTIGGFTPLMIAATNNEDDIVQFLCEYSGTPRLDLGLKNAEGGTALHHAVQQNAVESIEVLVKYGADPTIPNHLGHNCFHVAAINGKESVMKCLVESYPQFAEYGDLKDITPLHWACYHGNYKVAALLLDKTEIDINIQDSSGGTPLFAAAMEGRTNIIHLLIEYGADPNISRSDKDTPLHALLYFPGKMDPIKEVSTELLKIKENLDSKSKPPSVKTIVACFLVKETADLKKKGKNDKEPIDLISKDDISLVKSFSKESPNFIGSMKRSSIIIPEKKKANLWVEKRVATVPRDCGHLFCEDHANRRETKCPRCNRLLKALKDKSGRGKVCPICMKPDIDPLRSFSDMMNLPNDSDGEGEDKNFQQTLREMAASAAAEAAEHNCRQQ